MTIYNLKTLLTGRTSILQKRQKLIGLTPLTGKLTDATKISDLKVKSKKSKANETSSPNSGKVIIKFILMGTPEAEIFVDPENAEDLPNVVDDFGFDFNAGGESVEEDRRSESQSLRPASPPLTQIPRSLALQVTSGSVK